MRVWHLHDTFITLYLHGVGKVPLDLVEHVLAAAPEQHGASLGVLAALQEREVPTVVKVIAVV